MKKNYIVSIVVAGLFVSAIGFISCNNKPVKNVSGKEPAIDSSIALLVKPVNAQVIASIPAIAPESGARVFSTAIKGQVTYDTRDQTSISSRVSGRIERLYIKYNYQPVKQGQLIMEIYSPDLVAAQRELLFIAQADNDDNMLVRAKQRLSLLGMQPVQISQVLRTGKALYRVPVYSTAGGYILEKQATAGADVTTSPSLSTGGGGMDNMNPVNTTTGVTPAVSTTPLLIREGQYVSTGQSLFTIYRSEKLVAEFALKPEIAAEIKSGQRLTFQASTAGLFYTGNIGLVQPVIRNGENFTLARVYITTKDLIPGQLLTANIPVEYKTGWWLPKKAVWQVGNKAIVFRKQGNVFVPMTVETGVEAGGTIMIKTPIGGWMIAENASYLVDSESFIKTTGQSD